MTSAQETLGPLLVDDYLTDLGGRGIDEIRAMRSECQHAEVALSYVRRLIQGRLDIVNTFLEYPPVGASLDLGTIVRDLPGILTAGPGRAPGFGHLPMLIGPDTEDELTDELMAELDSVLGAEEIGRLVGPLPGAAPGPLGAAVDHRAPGVGRAPGAARAHRRLAGRSRRAPQDGTGLGRRPARLNQPTPASRPLVKELPERFNELGSFIREQRNSARLSLRRLSELAGVSNPYLSQIERGLRRPSAEILQQIAKALRISAETLYVQAGILERAGRRHRPVPPHLRRPPSDRGAAPGDDAHLPLLPARERGRSRGGSRHLGRIDGGSSPSTTARPSVTDEETGRRMQRERGDRRRSQPPSDWLNLHSRLSLPTG